MTSRQRGRSKDDCDLKGCTHYLTRSAHDTQEGSKQNEHTTCKLQKYLEFDSIQSVTHTAVIFISTSYRQKAWTHTSRNYCYFSAKYHKLIKPEEHTRQSD